MDAVGSEAQDLIRDLDRVRERTRGVKRASSVPLIVVGLLTIGQAFFAPLPFSSPIIFGDLLYWIVGGAVGFFILSRYYARLEAYAGVGDDAKAYKFGGLAVLPGLVLAAFIPFMFLGLLFFGALWAVALVLVVIGIRQRNPYLWGWALFLGIVGTAERLGMVSNRLYDLASWLNFNEDQYGFFDNSSAYVLATLGLLVLAAGLWAAWRERSAR